MELYIFFKERVLSSPINSICNRERGSRESKTVSENERVAGKEHS